MPNPLPGESPLAVLQQQVDSLRTAIDHVAREQYRDAGRISVLEAAVDRDTPPTESISVNGAQHLTDVSPRKPVLAVNGKPAKISA